MSLSKKLRDAAASGVSRGASGDSSIATRPRSLALEPAAPVAQPLEPPSVEDAALASSSGESSGSLPAEVSSSASSTAVGKSDSRKRRAPHQRKKRSISSYFFSQPSPTMKKYHCRLCGSVFTGAATTSRLRHVHDAHPNEVAALTKARAEGVRAKIEFEKIFNARLAPLASSRNTMNNYLDRKKSIPPPKGISSSVLTGIRKYLSFVISAIMSGVSAHAATTGFDLFFKEVGFEGIQISDFWKYVDIIYVFVFEKLQQAFQKSSSYCIGSDLWEGTGRYFLGLVLYSVDKDWNFLSHLIGLVPYSGSHFAENLSALVNSRLSQFFHNPQTSPILSASFTDGEATMQKMSRQVVCNEADVQYCPIHKLSLCFRFALGLLKKDEGAKLASKVVANAIAVITFLRSSAVSERNVSDFLESTDCDNLVVLAPNATRWRGIYLCLKRFVELKAAIVTVTKGKLSRKEHPDIVVDDNFFADISLLLPILEQGSKSTLLMEGRGSGMLSKVLFIISDLSRCLVPREGEGLFISQFKQVLLLQLQERFQLFFNTPSLPLRCALLSPSEYVRLPFSSGGIPSCVAWATVSRKVVEDSWSIILDECSLLLPADESEEGISDVVKKVRRHLDRFLAAGVSDQIPSDIDFYRSNPGFASFYPVAQMYLAMPSGTDEPERVFSDCGFLLSDRRTRMSGHHVEKLIVIKRLLRCDPGYYFDELVIFLVEKLFPSTT